MPNGVHEIRARVEPVVGEPFETSITVTTDNKVPKPTGVTATVVDGNKVRVAWDPPPPGSNVVAWYVYQDDAIWPVSAPAGSPWTSGPMAPGTYRFRVRVGGSATTARTPTRSR